MELTFDAPGLTLGVPLQPNGTRSPFTITFRFPLPLPGSPLCTLSISLSASVGVRILLSHDGYAQLDDGITRGAEEYVRRGGGVGVAGWVWRMAKNKGVELPGVAIL